MRRLVAIWILLCVAPVRAQTGEVLVSVDPTASDSLAAEQKRFEYRKKALELQPPGPQRDAQVKQEIQKHLAENKRISMQEQAARKEVISDLKQRWGKVESDWKTECTRHDAAKRQLDALPEGPAKTAAIEAENAAHRNTSKQIATERNVVHEGVMRQANREVMGGQTGTSNSMSKTAGTAITDPNHRGMNGDLDAGGGYRTTEKAAKILDEIGVKGPPDPVTGKAGRVKITGGVLETAPEFGLTVNAAPGADRIGSAGHQAQVNVGAQHAETYVSETGGALNGGPLKDHVATLDHTKKALHGTNAPPESLVGGSPEGQVMAKGTLKAANSAGLDPQTVEAIAAKNGVKSPDKILDTLAEIKTGRAAIASPEEAASLQKTSREILTAAETKVQSAAATEAKQMQTRIADLEAKGMKPQAQQVRNEIADYNAKVKAASDAVKGTSEPVRVNEEPKAASGGRLMKAGGAGLMIYGIYEGYQKAKEEMAANKQGESQGALSSTKDKAELAGRTFWHGLGFSGMAEIGTQAGKDAFDQYKKDIASGKISPNDWTPYLAMKAKALGGGLFAAGKAMTYDAAKQSGTNLGNAIVEGLGAAKDTIKSFKDARDEQKTREDQAKAVRDLLIKKGGSTAGAQMAADGVLKGDFTEANRINKVLDGKIAAKQAAADNETKARSYRERKKLAAKREAGKEEQKKRENATEDAVNLRETVIGKLKAKGLPANAGLIDGLVRILERDGLPALDAAIGEMTGMQGTFVGTLSGKGTLRITITGTRVTGTYGQTATASGATATVRGSISGDVELSSGTISMKMIGNVAAPGLTVPFSSTLSGGFTGKGYKGSATTPDGRASWNVSK
ncbi:hypothetical protein [Prosthecobacter sp.]|uniref:hypothetical protein n=1 Tax=Prosthecobacter sp. TaxID=1965333 RepID=UPI001D72D4FE|nr:hypothetical protein [Prosthecobacter sp.]MCB1274932.1 hypothetical protein [Prosthecobacter sp.]